MAGIGLFTSRGRGRPACAVGSPAPGPAFSPGRRRRRGRRRKYRVSPHFLDDRREVSAGSCGDGLGEFGYFGDRSQVLFLQQIVQLNLEMFDRLRSGSFHPPRGPARGSTRGLSPHTGPHLRWGSTAFERWNAMCADMPILSFNSPHRSRHGGLSAAAATVSSTGAILSGPRDLARMWRVGARDRTPTWSGRLGELRNHSRLPSARDPPTQA